MAAHVLTGLRQVADGEFSLQQLGAALDLASWTEELDIGDYWRISDMATSGDIRGIRRFAAALTPEYVKIWKRLGEPETREQWLKAIAEK